MNKKKLLAFALSLVMIAGSFSACGDSSTPGKNNDKELEEAPESLSIVSDEEKTTVADVTAITAGVDGSGKVVDKEGIVDVSGHKVYSTGSKDSHGAVIYTTGKKAPNGQLLYTKNEKDSFGEQIYYLGSYGKDGKLNLIPTTEKPDYKSNQTPKYGPKTERTTTLTIGFEDKTTFKITDAKSNYVKYFGGTGMDNFYAVAPCADGGFVGVGTSQSTDGDLEGASKDWDDHSFIVKYTAAGEQSWKYSVGGDGAVSLTAITELKDGSIVAVGSTMATDIAAPKNSMSASSIVVKLDNSGNFVWMYSFPGDEKQAGDYASCVAATPDGGFVVGGKASTSAGFFTGDYGNIKAYLFKFDKNCNIKWRRILSGSKSNNFQAVAVAENGDVYAVCTTASTDGDFVGLIDGADYTLNSILIKLNKKGDLQWKKNLDSTGNSEFTTICALKDGCVIGGNYKVYKRADGIYRVTYGKTDTFLIRFNANGEVNWSRAFGGSGDDYITGIAKIDGGFAICGRTSSTNYDFEKQSLGGETDGFVALLNENGKTCTVYMLDGKLADGATGICSLADGSAAVCGWTQSNDKFFAASKVKKQYKGFVANFTAVTEETSTTKK